MKFDASADPLRLLNDSVKEAAEKGLKDPNAMSLATADSEGRPSVRIVLFKGLVRGGLSFYTNYEGRKGRELAANPRGAVCFYWPSFDLQVRAEGTIHRLTREESEAYFRTRPRLSQLGAWASRQSESLAGMETLQAEVARYDQRFQGQEVPCPPHWGGYHLVPLDMEFLFMKSGRLHERFWFSRASSAGSWNRGMKFP